jgi:hypothetical protein
MHFRFPDIDPFSFVFGILLTSLTWWIVSVIRPTFQQLHANAQAKRIENKAKSKTTLGVEERYRQRVLLYAQGLHLAAPLFSLDEIIEPPLLLAPPPRVEPDNPILFEDIVSSTIPYLPAWPELAANYNAPTLTLAEALSGNSDIVLTGQPGMGKTVALADLASRLARRDSDSTLPEDIIPFLIHVADLDLSTSKNDPISVIIDSIAESASVLDLSRIPEFVRKSFSDGRALLMLDGSDELGPDGLKEIVLFIKSVRHEFPRTRIITTATIDVLDGLVTLNFVPFAMAAWNPKQRIQFLQKWGDLWTRFVSVEAWSQTSDQVDPLLLNIWLNSENCTSSPLELTLKTWGVYAGDSHGPDYHDSIETHLARLTPPLASRESLEVLALQTLMGIEPIFDLHTAREWIRTFEPPEMTSNPEDNQGTILKKSNRDQFPTRGLITKLVESGLLILHHNNHFCFAHPVFCGYLARKALTNNQSVALIDQPTWIGKSMALYFLSGTSDVSQLIEKLLSVLDRPLFRNLLATGRWLREAPRSMPWRGQVMARLVELLRKTGQPLGLRAQALCALILSEDQGILVLLRQLLEESDHDLLQLAALGSGFMRDLKAIDLLTPLLNSPSPILRRSACLALVNIGTSPAMDHVASALLHGDENLRRYAAEALANHSQEGHAMLKEGAGMKDDLLVRRSVVFGLGRIPERWAREIINHLETEDDQWAVRNAAMEVNENLQRLNPHIPQRLPAPTESPWIIAFAGKNGLGVSPEKPPIDLLLLALKSGTEEERLAALPYLRILPEDGVFGAIYQVMYGADTTLREAAFLTISEMASNRIDVPDPVQFGIGA